MKQSRKMPVLTADEWHRAIVDGTMPDGPFIATFPPKEEPLVVTPASDWLEESSGHALVSNALGEFRPVNYPEKDMKLCRPPSGTEWITLDFLDMVELPDGQYWTQVTGAFVDNPSAQKAADGNRRVGVAVQVHPRTKYVKFHGKIYTLMLDRQGEIPREYGRGG